MLERETPPSRARNSKLDFVGLTAFSFQVVIALWMLELALLFGMWCATVAMAAMPVACLVTAMNTRKVRWAIVFLSGLGIQVVVYVALMALKH